MTFYKIYSDEYMNNIYSQKVYYINITREPILTFFPKTPSLD